MAKTKIPGGYIADNAITGDHIADNVITSAMLHTSFTVSSSNLSSIDTDNVSEGSSNLYFTNARARGAISVSGNALSYNSSTGVLTASYEESPVFTGSITVGDSHTIGNDVNDNLEITSSTGENILINSANQVYLQTGGTTKLETTTSGISVTGTISSGAITSSGDIRANGGDYFTNSGAAGNYRGFGDRLGLSIVNGASYIYDAASTPVVALAAYTGNVHIYNELKMGNLSGTTVIDSSRNLINIVDATINGEVGIGVAPSSTWKTTIQSQYPLQLKSNTGTATYEFYAQESGTKEFRLFNSAKVVGYNQNLTLDTNSANTHVRLNSNGVNKLATTSTGIDVTGVVEATGYLAVEGTSGNTGSAGDRWIGGDGTAGTWFYNVPTGSNHYFAVNNTNVLGINSTGIDVTGTISSGNITTTGYLRGPSSFTIDPATHGDDTGTVVIAGNLQVDGTTTTINSTTLSVSDKQVTLGYDATTDAANNNAGIVVYRPETSNAYLLWNETNGRFDINRNLAISQDLYVNASGVQDTTIEIGAGTASNHYAYIDLIGDATYTDYGLRIIRNNGGANTSSFIYHRGTGNFNIETQEAASILLRTAGTTALTLDSSQNATFTGTISSGNITVGTADTTGGTIVLHGNGTGSSEGGEIRLHMAADSDTTYDYYRIDAYQDDLRIGRAGTTDLFIFQNGNVRVANSFEVGNQVAIDSSRNLTNIGTISSTYLVVDANKTASKTQIRATGWYGSASSSFTGTGVEIGGIGTSGTIIAYDRDASVYRGLNISATAIGLDPRGGSVNITSGGDLTFNGTLVIDESRNLTNIGTINSGAITANTGDASAQPLTIGSSASTNYTLQNWITSAHSGTSAYMIAYGASHGSQANNFAMKNLKSGGEIFFELFGVEPLRLTSTGATFAGTITAGANSGVIKEIGSDLSLVQGAIGLRINDAASALSPTTASVNNDAAVDLGVSNIRFRNLYLSGTISSGAITSSSGTSSFNAADIAQIEIGDGGTSAATDASNIGSKANYLLLQRDEALPIEIWGSRIESRSTHYFGGGSVDAEANIDTSGNFTTSGVVTINSASAKNALVLSGTSPTMAFTDTTSGHDNFWIHVNSNNFYVLCDRDGSTGAYNTWETPHALQLEADTNTGYLFSYKILTTADEGSGNGIDADTVDGIQGASFLRSDANDTCSGLITFTQDISVGSQIGTWITSDVMSDAIGWNNNYGVYIGSDIGGTHYLRGNGTFTTGGSTYNLWHTGNDGSGSGLDADTLDGVQASNFLRSNVADTATGELTFSGSFTAQSKYLNGATNFDALKVSGFYSLYNVNAAGHTNAPFKYGAMIQAGNTAQSGGMGMQIAHERTGAGTYIRGMNDTNDTWYAWREIWTAGTDGSGSGLDADTVDGIQGASFLRSDTADTATQAITFSGGIVVDGSIDSGGSDYGFYQSAGTNIILKGDASGRSGIFFQSEKNGTNINHPSDYGFIQFHSYGYGGSSGESIDMVIGTANDSDDHLILQTPYTTGLKFGYRNATSGTGLTQVNIWHAANDGSGSGLDADTLDGINSGSFLRSDADDTLTGHLQINSHAINMDLNNVADDAITMREVRSSTWPLQIVTNAVGNDNHSGFWVGSNGYPDMRLRRDDSTVRALISSWETSYVSNGFTVSGGNLTITGSTTTEDALKTTNGRIQLGPHSSGAGVWLDRGDSAQRWFLGLNSLNSDLLRFWRSGNKWTLDASGNTSQGGSITATDAYFVSGGAGNRFQFQSPTPTIRLIDANATSRYIEIGGENGSCNIAVDPGNAQGSSTFGVTIDGQQALYIDSDDRNYVNTSSNPTPTNATGHFNVLADLGDGVNIKHTVNGNNIINIWQTGGNQCNALAFYKGNSQTLRGRITLDDLAANGVSYVTSSDYRLKENIVPLPNATTRLMAMNPVQFDWIESGGTAEGFIAHELAEQYPGAVVGEKDAVFGNGDINPQGVDYGRITPLLVKTIQEQQALIESLQTRIEALEGE